jgi:ABC-2 type transport system ATP-binding protein
VAVQMERRPVPALAVRNLRVDYGDFTAVDDLSLELGAGEIFGLAGPNGAGKTSTIRVLATLLEPTYGDVEIFGHDLAEAPQAVHELLGYMPDLAPAIRDLKVWEFLDLYAHSHGFRGSEKRDRVDACLEKVKLADKRDVYGKGLSRGMTQRVVLAKTLLHDPKMLLLDEPASGMDPIARRDLRRILESLAAGGASILVSSHILSELSGMCTSVGIMHLGRLLQYGSMREVLSSIEVARVQVEMDVIGGAERAIEVLDGQLHIGSVKVEGRSVSFSFDGNANARCELLRELIAAGVEISAFTPRESGIESALMNLIGAQEE